ncbi:MAG TPA: hypothetical protein VEX86_27635 [Longimicrobium sp.]|nr:hypothetical protein [Longimicrobium sp.]
MRRLALSLAAGGGLLLGIGCAPPPASAPLGGLRPVEARALELYVEQRVARARLAWRTRNPSVLVAGPDSAVATRRPDGTPVTNAEIRADLGRRMAAVVRLDTLNEVITALRMEGDSAEVTTRQRFVRLVRAEGAERVRVSGVTHRQWFRRQGREWIVLGPPRESEQEAYWADERPRG